VALTNGTRIGPYEVAGVLGAGGMGEVYRARDLRLHRDVALKIVPAAFATDPDRLARMRREAQVLAALNHPNVAQIFGLEEVDDAPVLVLELVEGPTLAERLGSPERGLTLEQSLAIAVQIARALDTAHQQGIVHRDLKPANIKVNENAGVKVLDFGLAKALDPSDIGEPSESTTVTSPALTRHGTILGTAAYMAPEQARGRAVDKRADIWAFGCVLYEMLTGRRLFDADTVSDTIAAILTQDPAWAALPASTPDSIRRLLRRCLEKDPRRRLRDIGDALSDLEEPTGTTPPSSPVRPRRSLLVTGALAIVLVAGAATAGWYAGQRRAPSAPALVKQFDVSTPTLKNGARTFVLSPDGAKLAYIAGAFEAGQIYVRPFDNPIARRLEGTLEANSLFFSPDGQWLGFSGGSAIKKVPVDGGPVKTLCTSCASSGAAWMADDTIVFDTAAGGLSRIPADGGPIETITKPDATKNELRHAWPQSLPDGTSVLYTVVTSTPEAYRVAVASLKTNTARVIVEAGAFGRYVPSGHLVYVQGNTLMAAPFDPTLLTVTGHAVAVLDNVATTPGLGSARFDAALDGTLAFVKAAASDRRTLVWVTRQGAATPIPASAKAFWHLSLSPDGSQLIVGENRAARRDVGLYQLSTGASTLLTSADLNDFPEWSPDGKAVLYSTNAPVHTISRQLVDGSRRPEILFSSDHPLWVGSITGDQRRLIIMEAGSPSTGGDINLVDLTGDRKAAAPIVATRFTEWGGRLSPDEHALAYISNESGRWEVYVQAFPESGGRRQVSTDGGVEVVWARNGRELFYRNGPQLMAVPVMTSPTLTVGAPRLVFEGPYLLVSPGGHGYDITPDGQRFVMILQGEEEAASASTIRVRINFFDELRRRAPAGQ